MEMGRGWLELRERNIDMMRRWVEGRGWKEKKGEGKKGGERLDWIIAGRRWRPTSWTLTSFGRCWG